MTLSIDTSWQGEINQVEEEARVAFLRRMLRSVARVRPSIRSHSVSFDDGAIILAGRRMLAPL